MGTRYKKPRRMSLVAYTNYLRRKFGVRRPHCAFIRWLMGSEWAGYSFKNGRRLRVKRRLRISPRSVRESRQRSV